jgi:predicted DNA-binding protein
MTVIPKHSRTISFRLSETEYEVLRRLSEQKGAHSVSDYARWAVRHGMETSGSWEQSSLADQLRSLCVRVESLSREVTRLKDLMASS